MLRQFSFAAAAVLAVVGWGCSGNSDMPEVGHVTGRLTLDGNPVPDARITFAPTSGGQSSDAVSDADGLYELRYKNDVMGAKIGEHKVYVSTYEEAVRDDSGALQGGRKELFPKKYNSQTTLKQEVKPGENEIHLDLSSK